MKTIAFLFLASATMFFAGSKSVNPFAWLEGEWQMDSQEAYEIWEITNDTLMRGASYHNAGKEWLRDERIELKYTAGSFYYMPTVEGQNDNKPVPFKIISYTDTSFIAENPAHDFPKRISYRTYFFGTSQKLIAELSGDNKGKEKKIAISFTKAKGR